MPGLDSPTLAQFAAAAAVAVVLAGLLLTSPVLGLVTVDPPSSRDVGDGSATVSSVSVPTEEIRLTQGRFGTDVTYLRVPDALVTVDSTTGKSRLVYRVQIPELDVDLDGTKPVEPGHTGSYRIRVPDRALELSRRSGETYQGTVTVRVQSFTVDRTVANETIQVGWSE